MATVIIPPSLRSTTSGERRVPAVGTTVEDVLRDLARRYPPIASALFDDNGEVRSGLVLTVDGDPVEVEAAHETALGPAAELAVSRPLHEGQYRHVGDAHVALTELLVRAADLGERAVVNVVGPVGAGKSTVAARVSHEVSRLFADGITVVNFWRPGDGGRDAAGMILSHLGLPVPGPRSGREVFRAYQEALESRQMVIVLDGATDRADVLSLIPEMGASCLVVVSQAELDLPGAAVVPVVPYDSDADGWTAVTEELGKLGEPPAADPSPVLAGYVPDSAVGADQLGIDRDVDALASLIASKSLAPPLSIGLFGDWGTGKSFLVRSLADRVDALARLSGQAETRGDETAYCSNVRQVSFNAWHFADANLWASLVSRIWEGLAGPGSERAGMVGGLETSRTAIELLKEERRDAERDAAQLTDELGRLEAESAELFDELAALRGEDAAGLAPAVAAVDQYPALGPVLGDEETIGISELRSLEHELSGVRGHARALWRQLKRAPRRDRGLVVLGALLFAGIVGVVAFVPGVAGAVTGVLAGLGGFAASYGGLRQPLSDARDAAEALNTLGDELQRKAQANRRSKEERLEGEIATLRGQIERFSGEREQARQRAEATSGEIAEIKSGRQPYKFILERLSSDDYERHLGIMALIRRDLESLTELLRESADDPADGDDGVPRIDRVVLYIDDLDRCPATRVVEVLEAVHLLLAFDLFVVVVAVDVRWLLRSLEQHYANELSGGTPSGTASDHAWQSTPQNYLEKIFQIPFAVWPMEQDGFTRLIESLFEQPDDDESQLEVLDQPVFEMAAGVEATGDREAVAEGSTAAPAAGRGPAPSVRAVDLLNPQQMRLTPAELALMPSLFPLIGTPRGTKRFANTYRLLRASLDPGELVTFGTDAERFGPVQVLLATMIGVSGADALFECLLGGPPEDFREAIVKTRQEAVKASHAEPGVVASLRRLQGVVVRLQQTDGIPTATAPYVTALPSVARYSFTSARLTNG